MTTYNAKNERVKRDYFRYLTQAKGMSESTLAMIRDAFTRFERYTGYKDFATFNKEQAIAFKKNLLAQKNQRTGEPISKGTALKVLKSLQEFFKWLAWQTGYKSRLYMPDIEYFNLTDKEVSVAKLIRHKDPPTLEHIRKVIFSMPTETDIQRRDQALIAFGILTGMRDSALASLRLKHVDPVTGLVRQEPDMVRTKKSKHILTYFLPVGDDIKAVVLDWLRELREEKLYGLNDPVFPQTKMALGTEKTFVTDGLKPVCWASAEAIRRIFREAFEAVGLPYYNPHLLRKTLALLGQQLCRTPEEFKAWSQNFGHESTLTTFTSYGTLSVERQGEVIKALSLPAQQENAEAVRRCWRACRRLRL